jgi:hypothetical protein
MEIYFFGLSGVMGFEFNVTKIGATIEPIANVQGLVNVAYDVHEISKEKGFIVVGKAIV